MKGQFPWIPATVLDICLDSLADAFSAVAPSELKAALKPGGLKTVRPELEDGIVEQLRSQPMIKDLPIPASDKSKLLKYLVGLSLDLVLKDVEPLLQKPNEQLQVLELQKCQIQRYMTRWELTLYRMRYYPLQMTLMGVTTIVTAIFLCQQYQQSALASAVSGMVLTVVSSVKSVGKAIDSMVDSTMSSMESMVSSIQKFFTKLGKRLGIGKAAKRKAHSFFLPFRSTRYNAIVPATCDRHL
jgi:hypothetical protein